MTIDLKLIKTKRDYQAALKRVSLSTAQGSIPHLVDTLECRLVVPLGLDRFQVDCHTVVASIRSYSACVPTNRMNMICLSYRIATTSL